MRHELLRLKSRGGESKILCTHKMNVRAQKNQAREKKKIGIEKITFNYIAPDSREQRVDKAPTLLTLILCAKIWHS